MTASVIRQRRAARDRALDGPYTHTCDKRAERLKVTVKPEFHS